MDRLSPHGSQGLPPQTAISPLSQFSPEELHVFRQCNQESFFQRSLPLGAALGLGTLYSIQKGYLKPSARFGVFPKVTVAVVVGYFLGKVSYQQKCAEKFMALPNSQLGQLLRDRRDGKKTALGNQPPIMFGANSADIYSDAGPENSLDFDSQRPVFSEDTYRPDESSGDASNELPSYRPAYTYEDLRQKNRSEYSEARKDPYRIDPDLAPPPVYRAPSGATPTHKPYTNKYGDSME